MNFIRILLFCRKYCCFILPGLLIGKFIINYSVLAESTIVRPNTKSPLSLETFTQKKSSDRKWGRPPSRTSGGSRSFCEKQLVALAPGKDEIELKVCQGESSSFMTTTLLSNPTIWIYVPPSLVSQQAELAILDSKQRLLNLKSANLPAQGGIVGLKLDYPLEIGREYWWQLSAVVDPQSPAQNPTVEGIVSRIAPHANLNQQIAIADSQQAIADLYAREGIWQDTLTSLSQLRCHQPDNTQVKDDWFNLLNLGGLGAIASSPISNCQNQDRLTSP